MGYTVLDHLWANALSVPERALLSPVPKLLAKISEAPVVALSSSLEANSFKAVAAYADEELVPGASFSDLLYEECDIDVPEDAIIYVETAPLSKLQDTNSACITKLIGQIIIKLATNAETSALIEALAHDDDMPHISGDPRTFTRVGDVVQ